MEQKQTLKAAQPGHDTAWTTSEISRLGWLRTPRTATWAGVALLALAFLLYLGTLDNGLQPEELVGGDLITHQYAQVQARPSNAPGYPLYTMGGWLWFHGLRALIGLVGHSLPNPIPLLSSYSTLWALLALWLFYRIVNFVTRSPEWPAGEWPLAWLLTAFYAVTYFFWYYATTTEQYSSAIAQTLAIVYLYLQWQEAGADHVGLTPHTNSRRRNGLLLWLALLCGISLAHMLTVAFIVPPLVFVILWEAPALLRNWRLVIGTVAAAALPLVSYLYVYIRGAVHPEWWGVGDWTTPQAWFWAFVSTAQGRSELGWGFEAGRSFFGNQFPELIWHELSLPLLVIGILGIAWLGRKQAVLLYGGLVIYLLFCWAYRYGNWFQVILPAYPLILLGVAAVAMRYTNAGLRRTLVYSLLVAAIGWRTMASLPEANSRNRATDSALDQAASLIVQPLPLDAKLFAELHDAQALHYLIDIWRVRPDLQVVSSPQASAALRSGQTVFATWQSASTLQGELPDDLQPVIQSGGPDWLRFQFGGQITNVQPLARLDKVVDADIVLYGYTIVPSPAPIPARTAPQPSIDVTLYWQLAADWPPGLAISVRPVLGDAFLPNPAGPSAIVQQDRPRPAHGLLTTDQVANRLYSDAYRLPLPSPADGVLIILYRVTDSGFENVVELVLPLSQASS